MPNALELAAKLGEETAGNFGRNAFIEMETMFLGIVGRHPTFTSGFTRTRRRENVAICAPAAVGKAQPLDAKVLTPTGWKTMGELRAGDFAIGSRGAPVRILAIHPRGELQSYRIAFTDGSSTECGEDHLWNISSKQLNCNTKKWKVMSLRQILDKNWIGDIERNPRIQVVAPIEFAQGESLPIPPYTLGALLGNGCFQNGVGFTSIDDETIAKVSAEASEMGCRLAEVPSSKYGHALRRAEGATSRKNGAIEAIRELGLRGKHSHERFIPRQYMFASSTARLELLRGLMDTDGTANTGNCSIFTTTSPQLRDDFVHLVRSLGGNATIGKPKHPFYTHLGKRIEGRIAYNIVVRLPNGTSPFHLPRKTNRLANVSKGMFRTFEKVEPMGMREMRCITVDADDGLYVTDDFIVTHNSFLSDVFIEECMGAINYTESREPGLPRPIFGQIDGDSVSTETMRGGCTSDGRLIEPLILHMNLCYCTDLVTFLQSGDKRTKAVNFVLLMGEDGKQDVFFQKFQEMQGKAAQKFAEEVTQTKGITYIDSPRRGFRLKAAVPFLFCFTPRELRGGKGSLEETAPGFLSRFTILDHTPTDRETSEAWMQEVRRVDYSPLRNLNLQMWRTPIKDIPYPPSEYRTPILGWADIEAKEMAKEYGRPLHHALNQRLKARIARLMAASAIARAFEDRGPGDHSPIESIHYSEDDGRFARSRIDAHLRFLADRFSQESSDAQGTPSLRATDSAPIRNYIDFLKSLKEPWPLHASRRHFKAFCASKGIAPGTVDNYLTKLKDASIAERPYGADEMHNDPTWLESAGFREPAVEPDHDDVHPDEWAEFGPAQEEESTMFDYEGAPDA